ncbi:MAG: ribonuclease HII [Bacilli bacterium]|nr:ribonuclease HII [Bacilli bacterium]
MLDFERSFYSDEVHFIVGVDEAGRGPLAGPVVAAAVVFPPDYENESINDSKKLTAKKRMALFEEIKSHALGYGIAMASAQEIDKYNIYEATKMAMRRAIAMIQVPYELILTDAMPFKDLPVRVVPVIKGDAKALNIAAASILAKVTRDLYMEDLEKEHPEFSFSVHKGYGTKAHMAELEAHGPIEGVHRKSFKPVGKFYCWQPTLF